MLISGPSDSFPNRVSDRSPHPSLCLRSMKAPRSFALHVLSGALSLFSPFPVEALLDLTSSIDIVTLRRTTEIDEMMAVIRKQQAEQAVSREAAEASVPQKKEHEDRTEQSIFKTEIGSHTNDDDEPQVRMKGDPGASFSMRDVYADTCQPHGGEVRARKSDMPGIRMVSLGDWMRHMARVRNEQQANEENMLEIQDEEVVHPEVEQRRM
ncbi:hypothetical protein ACLB2K_008914 [Fragaria x ananassa]